MVRIRNTRTGEIKNVDEGELGNYGLGGSSNLYQGGNEMSDKLINAYLLKGLSQAGSTSGGRYLSQAASLKDLLSPEEEKLGATERVQMNMGDTGIRYLTQAKDIYQKDPSVLTKQKVPGQFFSRDFDNALFGTVESLLRLKSGQAVPESEVRRYMSKLAPTFGDNPAVVEQKFNNLYYDLANYARVEPEQITLDINKENNEPSGLFSGLRQLYQGQQERAGQTQQAQLEALSSGDIGGYLGESLKYGAEGLPQVALAQRPEARKAGGEVISTLAVTDLLKKLIGGKALTSKISNPLRSSVTKVGEKEAASVAGRSGQVIPKKAVIDIYKQNVAGKGSNLSAKSISKLTSEEEIQALEKLLGPNEYISVDDATNLLRNKFPASKTATTFVKTRNAGVRDALETLLGPETQTLTGEYAKAYGRQKLKSRAGQSALGTIATLPTALILGMLLRPLLGARAYTYQ